MTTEEKFNEIYDEFNRAFPIESLSEMKLEKYTNLNKDDSFCYWLETKTNALGSIQGSTSYKFGIYKFENRPSNDSRYLCDAEYAWVKKYGDTAQGAYNTIRQHIVNIAYYARKGEFEKIDDFDISTMFKWKIAFLYSDKKLRLLTS